MVNNKRGSIKTNTAMLRLIGHVIFVGSPEEKTLLRRPRRRWVYNIKMDPRQGGMVWTGSIWLMIGISGGLL
jgi:hypothetical protein